MSNVWAGLGEPLHGQSALISGRSWKRGRKIGGKLVSLVLQSRMADIDNERSVETSLTCFRSF